MLVKQMNHPVASSGVSSLSLADTLAASGGELDPKRFKWAALWWVVCGLVCALLNLALAPRYSGLGAAIAQSVSLDWSRLAMAMATILAAGLFLAPPWHVTAP